jgi:pimeloyl-ACP methyl ester carboxylesterase
MLSTARLLALLVAALLLLAAAASAASAKTVWLCKPGIAHNPCAPGLSTAVFSPTGRHLSTQRPKAVRRPAIDCFYVYPTVSGQKTTLANFKVDPVERSIALYQAARYAQSCRIFAPVYRQVTLTALLSGTKETPAQLATPLADVRRAFQDYLAHQNHGRGFVLIGHSQGSFVLRQLIAKDIDAKPAVRRRLVSAILLGGNVTVKRGSDVGGDFKHIRACHSTHQLGCVVAFSTYDAPVPANSLFGRAAKAGQAVLCTNPTALGGGSGLADLISPSEPFDPTSALSAGIKFMGLTYPKTSAVWVRQPGAYRARCSSANGAHVLQITALHGATTPKASPDPTWGLHLLDANIALGNLTALVGAQTRAYLAR